MICEPNESLPQEVNLDEIRVSNAKSIFLAGLNYNIQNVKPKVSYEQKDYNILPMFSDEFEHLNTTLSLQTNDYLACKWNQFLNSVPDNYVKIQLYMDYKESLIKTVVRPKILNGKFYGKDNKLAPIPVLNDPRKLGKINNRSLCPLLVTSIYK